MSTIVVKIRVSGANPVWRRVSGEDGRSKCSLYPIIHDQMPVGATAIGLD